jgi:hypothetical protein
MQKARTVLQLASMVVTVAVVGCSEPPAPPTGPRKDFRAPTVVRTTGVAQCEKNWEFASNGDWHDATAWLPDGVPASDDEVCIVEPGTYAIALEPSTSMDSLYVGPGVDVTFESPIFGSLSVDEELVVASGASLTLLGKVAMLEGSIINDGSLRVRDSSIVLSRDRLVNNGYLELATRELVYLDSVVNAGDLRVEEDILLSATHVELVGGRVLGPGTLSLLSTFGVTVEWRAGQLGLRGDSTRAAQVSIQQGELILADTGLVGAIDLRSDNTVVRGDIGPGVDLGFPVSYLRSAELRPLVGRPLRTPVTNHGAIRFGLETDQISDGHVDLLVSDELINRGTITSDGRELDLEVPLFRNYGTLSASAEIELGTDDEAIRVENFGSILAVGAPLTIHDGTFLAAAGSVQEGTFEVHGATIAGSGRLGRLNIHSGILAPGAGIATLTLDGLLLLDSARVHMEVAGSLVMDRIDVRGDARYGGVLEVRALGGFASVAGRCGQVLPMFTDQNASSGKPRGAFQYFGNVPGGLGRFWRAHYGRDTVFVTGYDPTASISTTLNGTLAEGGPPATGQVCIGLPVSGSDVTARLNALDGQFTIASPILTFGPGDFALPRAVQYQAVDDTRSEGPHHDQLIFALTQAGVPFGSTPPIPTFAITDNEPAVDLTVSIASANNPVTPSQQFERLFRVTNLGPGASTGATVTIPAINGVTFAANRTGASCAMNGADLQCSVGAIAAGASYDFVVLFRAPTTAGAYDNTYRIRGSEWDNATANNTVAWTLTVN